MNKKEFTGNEYVIGCNIVIQCFEIHVDTTMTYTLNLKSFDDRHPEPSKQHTPDLSKCVWTTIWIYW